MTLHSLLAEDHLHVAADCELHQLCDCTCGLKIEGISSHFIRFHLISSCPGTLAGVGDSDLMLHPVMRPLPILRGDA